jgi:membrane protein
VVHRDDGGGVDTTRPVGGRAERGIARADDAAQPSEAPRLSALVAAVLPRIDRLQQRHRVLGVPYAVFKRFGEHDGGRLTATVAYYSFFSVFPLLLVFVTVLGIVLQNNDDLREDLVEGAIGQIPVIGSQLADTDALPGDGLVLVLGILTSLWAGLGAVAALQQGLEVVADVPVHERGTFVAKKVREVAFLFLFAGALSISTLASNLNTIFDVGAFTGALGVLATALVNAALLLMMFIVLPAQRRPTRDLLPGIIIGAILLTVLQQLGSFVVRHYIAGASDTYGTFAIVIALLSWFYLVNRVVLMSAQANAVIADGLSPRRLRAEGAPTEADRRATMLDVQRIQRDNRLGYAVSVHGEVATNEEPLPERTG